MTQAGKPGRGGEAPDPFPVNAAGYFKNTCIPISGQIKATAR